MLAEANRAGLAELGLSMSFLVDYVLFFDVVVLIVWVVMGSGVGAAKIGRLGPVVRRYAVSACPCCYHPSGRCGLECNDTRRPEPWRSSSRP